MYEAVNGILCLRVEEGVDEEKISEDLVFKPMMGCV